MIHPHPIRRSALALAALLCALALAIGASGHAQDDELYAPAPPPGAAFVRVTNAASDALDGADVAGTAYDALAAFEVSPYRVVEQGAAAYDLGGVTGEFAVEAGGYYTIVRGAGGVAVLADAANENRARALLAFYNLTGAPLSLKTLDGSTPIFEAVPPGETISVEVNPVAVEFGVFAGDDLLTPVEGLRLARGSAVAAFVFAGADGPVARAITAATETD